MPRAVRLHPRSPSSDTLDRVAGDAAGLVGQDVVDVLAWAAGPMPTVPAPGGGETLLRWELLATIGAQDLTVARVVEPHLDALAILEEAGDPVPAGSTWGVWAAEGPGARLEATRAGDGWTLTGRKPWCSLADDVTHGLVTAWVDEEHRGLFSVVMDHPGVEVETGDWAPTGLRRIPTSVTTHDGVPADLVGDAAGWYLTRPGFAWGGIGVAAVWHGGAVALGRRLLHQASSRDPDQLGLWHLGCVDTALTASRTALATAAARVDEGGLDRAAASLLAARVRQVVADACETVLTHVAHGLGPGPLTEREHADRVADLSLYLRQHHAERDTAAIGRMLLVQQESPW